MSDLPIRIRPRAPTDDAFIYSSWLESYRQSPAAKKFSNEIYFGGQKKVVNELLSRAVTLVACATDDPDQIYGYVCFEPGVLHYVYVKQIYREHGVAKLLTANVGQIIFEYSHLVPSFCVRLADSHFNPWAVL